jgi:hypothetical protein
MPARPAAARGVAIPWRAALAAAALALVLAVAPSSLVEGAYAHTIYPRLQAWLTGAANALPFAAFDVGCLALVLAVVLIWWASARAWRAGALRALALGLARTVVLAAAAVAWFEIAWGLNYARPPVDVRLALPRGGPSSAEVAALLQAAVAAVNRDHHAAHGEGFPSPRAVPTTLVTALHAVEADDGRRWPTVAGRPKSTLFAPYFRMAGVDGLTAPPLLETVLNPDLTGPERPFVLAHEWAHLAGYAPEADANFIAWRVTQRATVASRYSGWLFLVSEAARQVPAAIRREVLGALGPGPREDLADIERRAAAQVAVVQRVGWRVYDGYLRSQGVAEGVASYSRVVELIVRSQRPHGPSLNPSPR